MDEEIFDNWNLLKKKLNSKNKFPSILEGEVWWCSLGKNVGVEINGKNANFTRPILIVKKLSSVGFIGVPLTSQIKNWPPAGNWRSCGYPRIYVYFNKYTRFCKY